jgi:glutamine---fructose-6-phosphate transaminase (isomerizing)
MCGIFGLARSPEARHPEWASDAFVALGVLAGDRATGSAGVALPDGDGWRVVRGRGRFTDVWSGDLLPGLDDAPVALGHSRWTAYGGHRLLAGAGPVVAGTLAGTHDGDVDETALREAFGLPPSAGGTGGEAIFEALAAGHRPVEVLTALHGRAALAWADRARPGLLYLARAALSPLCVAVDEERNVYWATNPAWLREVGRATRVRLRSAVLLREGTFLTIEDGEARGTDFAATARPGDLLMPEEVWPGFTPADRERDLAQRRHRVNRTRVA